MLGRVFKRGDIWWVAFSCKGKEYRRSAKSLRKSDAQTLLRKYLGQVADGTFMGFHEDRLFVHELLDDHLEDFIQRGDAQPTSCGLISNLSGNASTRSKQPTSPNDKLTSISNTV